MNLQENILNAIKQIETIKNGSTLLGTPSGYTALDRFTNGFQGGNLYVLAGRPSMGKSALAVNILRKVGLDFNRRSVIFSLEQNALELTKRIIAAAGDFTHKSLYNGQLKEYEWAQLNHLTQKLAKAPILLKDYFKLTVDDFSLECRKLNSEERLELIIVDNIHRLSLSEVQRKYSVNREQEISVIVRELKALAKELNVPILAISQLNRMVETRGGEKRPILSDMRDSGAVEDEADVVIFLYRPEYYNITEDEMGNPTQGLADLIIAKNRNGERGTLTLHFVASMLKYENLEFEDANSEYFGSSRNFENQIPATIRLGSRLKESGFPASGFDDEPPF